MDMKPRMSIIMLVTLPLVKEKKNLGIFAHMDVVPAGSG